MSQIYFQQSSPLTVLSQSTLLDSSRSGSVMALPGSIFLKKAKSSWVILEKGSLSGAATGDGLGPSAPVCSFWQRTPNCHEVLGRNRLQGLRGEYLSVALDEKVLCGLRCLRHALRFTALWKIPTMTGEIVCRVGNTGCREEAGWIITCFHKIEASKLSTNDILIYLSGN